ncbi:hypothetical protein HK098_001872 [Nowakowskiella sp. JEL0407]|nr:hypothetical protein HK098_001872 [Nowakowskiella sp. JEL0407]
MEVKIPQVTSSGETSEHVCDNQTAPIQFNPLLPFDSQIIFPVTPASRAFSALGSLPDPISSINSINNIVPSIPSANNKTLLPPQKSIEKHLRINSRISNAFQLQTNKEGERNAAPQIIADSGLNMISLHVCSECQDLLLNAFKHCLSNSESPKTKLTDLDTLEFDDFSGSLNLIEQQFSKQTDPSIPQNETPKPNFGAEIISMREIDDQQPAYTSDPPYFELIANPTKPTPSEQIFKDTTDKVKRDIKLYQSLKQDKKHSDTSACRIYPPQQIRYLHQHPKPKNDYSAAIDCHKPHDLHFSTTNETVLESGRKKLMQITASPFLKNLGRKIATNVNVSRNETKVSSLFERQIEAKERKIKNLSNELRQRSVITKYQHVYVECLQKALQKSMQYYAYAEQWQEDESEKLKCYIHILKSEMSSLMGLLITSEEEKRKALIQIEERKIMLQDTNLNVLNMEKQLEQRKVNLHEAYKEFLTMNTTMCKLQGDADTGTRLVLARNEILQRNLEKLSKDFETSSKDLASSQVVLKEIEFALDELVGLFNACGDAKRGLEEFHMRATADINRIQSDLTKTKAEYGQLVKRSTELETNIGSNKNIQQQTKAELEDKIKDLKSKVERVSAMKMELEITLKHLKADNEKVSLAIKTVTKSKEVIDASLKKTTLEHKNETTLREETIKKIEKLREIDFEKINALLHGKSLFASQIEEVQDALDQQTENLAQVQAEIQKLKRATDENTSILQTEIDKLTNARNNLSNDKNQLADKLMIVTNDLNSMNNKLKILNGQYAANHEVSEMEVAELTKSLEDLSTEHNNLELSQNDLQANHDKMVDANVKLKVLKNQMIKRCENLDLVEKEKREQIQNLKEIINLFEREYKDFESNRNLTKEKVGKVGEEIRVFTHKIDVITNERDEILKIKNNYIAQLTSKLYKSNLAVENMQERFEKLKNASEDLTKNLKDKRKELAGETAHRESLEQEIFQTRKELMDEKKNRRLYERMHEKLDKYEEMRERDIVAMKRFRENLMKETDRDLKRDILRLKSFCSHLVS